jgi:hypothetical protein
MVSCAVSCAVSCIAFAVVEYLRNKASLVCTKMGSNTKDRFGDDRVLRQLRKLTPIKFNKKMFLYLATLTNFVTFNRTTLNYTSCILGQDR